MGPLLSGGRHMQRRAVRVASTSTSPFCLARAPGRESRHRAFLFLPLPDSPKPRPAAAEAWSGDLRRGLQPPRLARPRPPPSQHRRSTAQRRAPRATSPHALPLVSTHPPLDSTAPRSSPARARAICSTECAADRGDELARAGAPPRNSVRAGPGVLLAAAGGRQQSHLVGLRDCLFPFASFFRWGFSLSATHQRNYPVVAAASQAPARRWTCFSRREMRATGSTRGRARRTSSSATPAPRLPWYAPLRSDLNPFQVTLPLVYFASCTGRITSWTAPMRSYQPGSGVHIGQPTA
jgi:hypothetical protein